MSWVDRHWLWLKGRILRGIETTCGDYWENILFQFCCLFRTLTDLLKSLFFWEWYWKFKSILTSSPSLTILELWRGVGRRPPLEKWVNVVSRSVNFSEKVELGQKIGLFTVQERMCQEPKVNSMENIVLHTGTLSLSRNQGNKRLSGQTLQLEESAH